jgi:hypothetical protein
MVYLHTSLTPLGDLSAVTGSYKGGRPKGFWYGHDLSWIDFMTERKSWYPSLRSEGAFPYSVRAIYEHALGRGPLPPHAEGEELQSVSWPPHYVYAVPIPESAFSDTPGPGSILRLTPETLPAFRDAAQPAWEAWKPTGRVDEEVARALRTKSPSAAALRALDPKLSINDLATKKRMAILDGLWAGTIPADRVLLPILDSFWGDYFNTLRTQWGGVDFADAFFPVTPETVQQVSLLRFIDAGSGVLFTPSAVLPSPPTLLATIRWDAGPGVRVGITRTGELRSLPSAGGRRRRRTRRRMLQKPKTLKKRIR